MFPVMKCCVNIYNASTHDVYWNGVDNDPNTVTADCRIRGVADMIKASPFCEYYS